MNGSGTRTRRLRRLLAATGIAGCAALAAAAPGTAAPSTVDAEREAPAAPATAPPELHALEDSFGVLNDTEGDVDPNGPGGFYVSPDLLSIGVAYLDNAIGRVDDDTVELRALTDARPTAGIDERLFENDYLRFWVDTDNNAGTGAPYAGQPAGIDRLVEIEGVSPGGQPTRATVWEYVAAQDDFRLLGDVAITKIGLSWGVRLGAQTFGIVRGRPIRMLVTASTFSPGGDLLGRDLAPNGGISSPFTIPAPPPAPVVDTAEATGPQPSGMTVGGTVTPGGSATTWYVRYGVGSVNEAQTPEQSAGEGTAPVAVSTTLTGLLPGTTYQYQVVAKNPWGETAGPIRTGRTADPVIVAVPVATTQPRDVGTDRATLTGTLDTRGRAVTWFFEWGPTTRYGNRTPRVTIPAGGAGLRSVTASLRNLKPKTGYNYRLVVEDGPRVELGQNFSLRTQNLDRLVVDARPSADCLPSGCTIREFFLVVIRVRDGDTGRIVSSTPRGVSARVRCLTGCGVSRSIRLKGRVALSANIADLFQGRQLRSGTTFEVRATRPGVIGGAWRVTFVRNAAGRWSLAKKTCEIRPGGKLSCQAA